MKIANRNELKEQILLMLHSCLQHSHKMIPLYNSSGQSSFVPAYEENIKKCLIDIENINIKFELLESLIINNVLIKRILHDADTHDIYVTTFQHNKILEHDYSGLKIKNKKNQTLCDIHLSPYKNDGIITEYLNLNLDTEIFIVLSDLENGKFEFYNNKIITESKKKSLIHSLKMVKSLAKQFSYYDTPFEMNMISKLDNPSVKTQIKYLNTYISEGEFSVEKQLNSFQRYYNAYNIYTVEDLNDHFKNIRLIRKYLSKKKISFNFVIDVITNMPPRVYFNKRASVNDMSNILFIEVEKDITLEKFLKKTIHYGDYSISKNTSYTIVEYLNNKEEIDTLMKLMQY